MIVRGRQVGGAKPLWHSFPLLETWPCLVLISSMAVGWVSLECELNLTQSSESDSLLCPGTAGNQWSCDEEPAYDCVFQMLPEKGFTVVEATLPLPHIVLSKSLSTPGRYRRPASRDDACSLSRAAAFAARACHSTPAFDTIVAQAEMKRIFRRFKESKFWKLFSFFSQDAGFCASINCFVSN